MYSITISAYLFTVCLFVCLFNVYIHPASDCNLQQLKQHSNKNKLKNQSAVYKHMVLFSKRAHSICAWYGVEIFGSP